MEHEPLTVISALAADVETVQYELDAAVLALQEAARNLLLTSTATLTEVSEATGMDKAELLRLLEPVSQDLVS